MNKPVYVELTAKEFNELMELAVLSLATISIVAGK